MRYVVCMLVIGIFGVGCKKDDPPKPPGQVMLVAPARNSECTPVQETGDDTNIVEFRWQEAAHTDSYQLRVTNLTTNNTQTKNTGGLSETLSLQKGAPYSWVVVSRNNRVTESVTSDQWFFYNPGSQTSHAPFPAEILEPTLGATVFKDINNEVTLRWTAADIDGDISGYEIFFSTETPPETLIISLGSGDTEHQVSVSADTVYYWQVVVTDEEGNSSQSGIYDFKVF